MKQTIKTIIFLALMILTAGQAIGQDLGYIICNPSDLDGGSLSFYKGMNSEQVLVNQISIDATTHKSGNLSSSDLESKRVYILATADETHQNYHVNITVEKKVDSGDSYPPDVPWWDDEINAPQFRAPSNNELTVTPVSYGIYYFEMPDDGSNVQVSATFPTKTALTITADSDTKNYDGTALTKNSYTYTGLVEGDVINSVTITGSQTNVGSSNNVPSAAVIKDANNVDVTDCYNITYENGTLTVVACQSSDAIVALTIPEGGYTYDGTEKQPAVTVTIGNAMVEGTEYTVSYADNINAGTATVTIEDNPGGNYAFVPLSATFEIGKATLAPTAVTITGWKYGDTANAPTIGEIASNGTITYTYADDENGNYMETVPTATGTHWVKASVAETTNYNAAESAAVSFEITKKPLTDKEVEVSISKDNSEYTVTVKHGESTLVQGTDYTLGEGQTNSETNDYTVKVCATENGNYTGEVDITYIGVTFTQPGADDNTGGQPTEDVDCYAAAQVSQDMALPEGMVAVMITNINPTTGVASALKLDYMPKDVPFILMKKGDADGFTAKDVTPSTDPELTELSESDKNANKLEVAGDSGADLTEYQDYIWFKGELVLVSGGRAKKGDFFVHGSGSGNPAPRLSIVIEEGETTSLGSMHNSQCIMHNDSWYTLDGRKLSGMPTKKGLYINQGKTIAIK